jgi:hypothetical protein
VKLLESVVIIDYQKDISKNAKQVRDSLNYRKIRQNRGQNPGTKKRDQQHASRSNQST